MLVIVKINAADNYEDVMILDDKELIENLTTQIDGIANTIEINRKEFKDHQFSNQKWWNRKYDLDRRIKNGLIKVQ